MKCRASRVFLEAPIQIVLPEDRVRSGDQRPLHADDRRDERQGEHVDAKLFLRQRPGQQHAGQEIGEAV